MAAIKALALQNISKVGRVSESSETTYNLESSDESSCNSDVDILDLLISETTRKPENLFCDKNSRRTADCKLDKLTIPPTLYDLSWDACKYHSYTDLKTQFVEMPPVNFDVRDANCSNTLNGKENSIVTDSAIDDLLSTLTINEQKPCIKSVESNIISNLVDFLENTEVKCESIDDSRIEVSNAHGQPKSCDQVSSLSLAALAQHHFQENQFDFIQKSEKMPDKEKIKSCCSVINDEAKELISHNDDLGISLSALAESYFKSENDSSCITSHALSAKNVFEQTADLDILSFISSVDCTEEDSVKLADRSMENSSWNAKETENCVFSELLKTDKRSNKGCDYVNFASETENNCVSLPKTLTKQHSNEIEDLDLLSFINSVSIIENDDVKLSNCSQETLSLNMKESENCTIGELLATDESPDEGYDSGKLSPGIDLNNCIKRPITPSPLFKSSLPSDDCSILPPQDDCRNLELIYVSTTKIPNKNFPNTMPKPSLVNTKQSLFAKVLSCKYKQQNDTTVEKVSDIKRKLFEKYFCTTEQDILCEVPSSKKRLLDKSTDSVITSAYLHFSALPSENC